MNKNTSEKLAKLTLKPCYSVQPLSKDNPLDKASVICSEYFQKLSRVESSCNQIRGDLKMTKKLASMRIKKDFQGFNVKTQTFDDLDENWKKEFQKLKAKREESAKIYDSLKGLNSEKFLQKQPIQRMKAKKEFSVQDTKQIGFSDVSSDLAKQILSSNKRNFGEVFLKKNNSEVGLGNKKLGTVYDKGRIILDLQTCKAGGREVKLLDKIRKVPKLAKQIKSCKKTGK